MPDHPVDPLNAWIDAIRAKILPGYYLEGDDGQPWPEKVWCLPCAQAVAFHYRRRRGMRQLQPWECWAGDDGQRYCSGCGALLDTGGLSTYGVNDELDHFRAHGSDGSAAELVMVLHSMPDDDARRPAVLSWLRQEMGEVRDA